MIRAASNLAIATALVMGAAALGVTVWVYAKVTRAAG